MTTVLDSMDAANGGMALYEEWKMEFMAEWFGPAMDMMLVQMAQKIAGADPMTRMMLEARDEGRGTNGMQVMDELANGGGR